MKRYAIEASGRDGAGLELDGDPGAAQIATVIKNIAALGMTARSDDRINFTTGMRPHKP